MEIVLSFICECAFKIQKVSRYCVIKAM